MTSSNALPSGDVAAVAQQGGIGLYEAERTAHRDAEAVRKQLAQQAAHDPLTGLLTRGGLAEQARQRRGRDVATTLLILDLDQFKLVNDSIGRAAGDKLLVVTARRLSHALPPGDLLAPIPIT